jgi:hypothetical protein
MCNTIPYEVLTSVSQRVKRVYGQEWNGEVVKWWKGEMVKGWEGEMVGAYYSNKLEGLGIGMLW